MMKLTKDQESIINNLLNALVAYIDEFDGRVRDEFQKETTESGGVTPHVAKELHDNIKRAFKISGKDYGSDMCCFSKNDTFGKPFEIAVTEGTHVGVFDSDDNCIYEGESMDECIEYCKKNNYNYVLNHDVKSFSRVVRKCFDKFR